MQVDIKALRAFVAVAASGSISRAAEIRHIAQPALSLQIKQMEDFFGTALFERNNKGVRLTGAGDRLLPHALDVIKRFDVAIQEIRSAVDEPSGRVAVGMPQSLAKYLTVPLVGAVVNQWPNIELQILELSTGFIPDQLIRGQLDLGLLFGADEGLGLQYTHLLDEDLVFIASKQLITRHLGSSWANRKTIALAQLAKMPIILPTASHSLRKRIDSYLAKAGVKLNLVAEANTIPQLIELASAGVGGSILSEASVSNTHTANPPLALKISKPAMTRSVYLCKSNAIPLSIATAKVQSLIQSVTCSLVQRGIWAAELAKNSST